MDSEVYKELKRLSLLYEASPAKNRSVDRGSQSYKFDHANDIILWVITPEGTESTGVKTVFLKERNSDKPRAFTWNVLPK